MEPWGSNKLAPLRNSGRYLGGFALSWMVCILRRESVQQTVQPFKGTRSIPRSVIPGGTNNGNDILRSFALDAGASKLPQLNKAEAYQDANNVVL